MPLGQRDGIVEGSPVGGFVDGFAVGDNVGIAVGAVEVGCTVGCRQAGYIKLLPLGADIGTRIISVFSISQKADGIKPLSILADKSKERNRNRKLLSELGIVPVRKFF